jgi:membrane protease YdiL (CAAX protease family)
MAKQRKDIYISLMNRIALVMLVNQGLLLVLSKALDFLKLILVNNLGKTDFVDAILLASECVNYFLSFILPVVLFNKMNKYSQKEIYEPKESDKKTPIYTTFLFGMGLAGISCSSIVNYYLVNCLVDYSKFSSEVLWSVELNKPYQVIFYFISCAIIPAIVEEFLFRGTVCRVLGVYGKGTAVLISALLFALMHTNIEQLLFTFVAGLFFGWLYVETKSIKLPILLHFINNSISAFKEILYQNAAPIVYEIYSSLAALFILVFGLIGCIGFFYYIKKHKISFKKGIEMKADENGNEVLSLSISERISGFFSRGMVIFIAYSIVITSYFIYLSVIL